LVQRLLVVETSGPTLAVFNASGTFYAIDDKCPHMGCPLSEGDLEGTILTCSCHGSQFDLTTGALVRGPATKGVRTHPTHLAGDDIEVEL
jgi:nitrite reductase/ring-hydroxylating ferredoxin subunit